MVTRAWEVQGRTCSGSGSEQQEGSTECVIVGSACVVHCGTDLVFTLTRHIPKQIVWFSVNGQAVKKIGALANVQVKTLPGLRCPVGKDGQSRSISNRNRLVAATASSNH